MDYIENIFNSKLIENLDEGIKKKLNDELKRIDELVDTDKIKVTDEDMERLGYYFPILENSDLKEYLLEYSKITNSKILKEISELIDDTKVLSKYTVEDAVEDGTFVLTGYVGEVEVYFTFNLFQSGEYKDEEKRKSLVIHGLNLLKQPDKEDTHWKLRVVEKDKIWVIHNSDGIIFMRPEDY